MLKVIYVHAPLAVNGGFPAFKRMSKSRCSSMPNDKTPCRHVKLDLTIGSSGKSNIPWVYCTDVCPASLVSCAYHGREGGSEFLFQ